MSAAAPAEDLFTHLRAACGDDWTAYVRHPFVRALADGSLPQACFRRYLVQDYLFLVHFARAYGLAAFKAETLGDIRAAAAGLTAIVDRELDLHVAYCEGWGMHADELGAAEEADATVAYTRFVLEKGLSGDLLDLQVALAPCVVGYGEIGRTLADDPATLMSGNPYESWIEMYAGADYRAVADAHVAWMSEIFARRGGPARLSGLAATFRQATRLERAFWDMAFATTPAASFPA